jgi:hypothetical protein
VVFGTIAVILLVFTGLLPFVYWALWPRHSPVVAGVLFLIALVQCVRRRRNGLLLALVAALLFAWFAAVIWLPHSLQTGSPVSVEIKAFGPNQRFVTITVADPQKIAQLIRPFQSVSILPGRALCRGDYWITFHSADGTSRHYRLQADGAILNDVPASEIQDVYLPRTPIPFELLPPAYRHGHNLNPATTFPAGTAPAATTPVDRG